MPNLSVSPLSVVVEIPARMPNLGPSWAWAAVAAVASRLGLSNLIGYAGQGADAEVKGQVDQVLALRGQGCDWRGRQVTKAAMAVSR